MKRKGFTLIELLAVIVVLAIIALIAAPIILGVIENSRKKSFEDTGYGVVEAIKNYYVRKLSENGVVGENVFLFPDSGLSLSGTEPAGGVARLHADGSIELAIHNNQYCVKKEVNQDTMTSTRYDEGNCKLANETGVETLVQKEGEVTTVSGCTGSGVLSKVKHTSGDVDYRYQGSCPNNYVKFNGNQLWRIIGIFDGKIKLVGEPIGNYSWDTSKETVNRGLGVNEWSESDLMKLLNPGYENNSDLKCNTNASYVSNNGDGYAIANCGDNSDSNYTTQKVNNSLYWNAGSGLCYNYGNYQTTSCNFTSTGLRDNTSKNMIEDVTWYLGSNHKSDDLWGSNQIMTAEYLYNIERSNNSSKQCSSNAYYCSDKVNRKLSWRGKVGLIYPSDYAYATNGGATTSKDVCLGKQIGYVSDSSTPNWSNTYTECKDNNWLLNKNMWTWSLSPRADSSYSGPVFAVDTTGHVDHHYAMTAGSVRPVVYLKSSVSITGGEGTQSSPFELSISS